MPACARLLMIAAATVLVVACDGHDPLGPGDVAGTWVQDHPAIGEGELPPDTLVLDRRGGGRIKAHVWLDPVAPGGASRAVWGSGPVDYLIRRDDVFLRWCVQAPGLPAVRCPPDGFRMAGLLRRDGRLWIGPTAMTSSLAYMPWVRVARDRE